MNIGKELILKPKTNGYPRLDLNFPDYDDEEDDFDTVRDSLASRLVSKTSTETPTTSFEKPDLSSDNRSLIPCSEVKWIRNIGSEVTGSNVYYGIEGTATRLRSFNEIERYCNKNNIHYDPSLFDFRKEDTESQEVNMVEVDIPNCYKQAIRSREASKWHDAMDREINIMKERKAFLYGFDKTNKKMDKNLLQCTYDTTETFLLSDELPPDPVPATIIQNRPQYKISFGRNVRYKVDLSVKS
ncbi:retrovirus-related Pol polyprotein from transposon RE1 [Trichonephila clavata]|uniref:Retrovirus-related Pol polyprotein from transposon RE1 n=1 Tax=Trichonephila clavata TaxID=2740835 RepID=A0A8X6KVA0_TRICU|nr:retrovirus-related Pol polyprotein from transposon RE1 [Trichonephila clavata]